ncbi:hypothetical protein HanIR_Chr06g0272211 [Helianthus annuus]|nr:hypothetical protein HanIR_Chr06g0272211 [Helianthus annuus]
MSRWLRAWKANGLRRLKYANANTDAQGTKKEEGASHSKAQGNQDHGKSRSWRCELGPNTLHSPLCASG